MSILVGMTSEITTVKLRKTTRERIACAARAENLTAGEFLERVISAWERQRRLDDARNAMAGASAEDARSYSAELDEWDQALLDGLGE